MLAAGLVTIAHDSGGPKADIIGPGNGKTGYLASTVEGYAEKMHEIFTKKSGKAGRCGEIKKRAEKLIPNTAVVIATRLTHP